MSIVYRFFHFIILFIRSYWYMLLLGVISFLYLVLRVGWAETIEFGYDQPKMAIQTQRFIADGSFLTSHFYNDITPLGNLSWGPSFIFLLTPFFLFSSNPIFVSQMIGVYNVLSIVIVWYIGTRFFTPVVGLSAALFLAVQPWWVIFSRMIYSPSMGPTLIALCILLTFIVVQTMRSRLIAALVVVWGVLLQIYLNHLSTIFVSVFGILFAALHRLNFRWLILGGILVFFLFVPTIFYYYHHPDMFYAYFRARDSFDSDVSALERLRQVTSVYFFVLSGGAFGFQLGSAEDDFLSQSSFFSYLPKVALVLIMSVMVYSFFSLFFVHSHDRILRFLLLLWATGPLWFLTLVRTPEIVPRYFLLSFPAFSLLFGLFFKDFILRIPYFVFRIFAITSVYGLLLCWVVFIVYYYSFIRFYDYPRGFLSYTSDPPAYFVAEAFRWIEQDARNKSYSYWIVSTRPDIPFDFGFLNALRYYWQYVLKRDYSIPSSDTFGYYVVYYTPVRPQDIYRPRNQFGPLVVFDYTHDHKLFRSLRPDSSM